MIATLIATLLAPSIATSLLLATPVPALADDALLAGFSAGGALAEGRDRKWSPLFRVAAGLDWLEEGGLIARSRVEATHERDLSFALAIGYFAEGLRTNEGSPFGAAIGGAIAIDRDGRKLAGPRAELVLGLWYSRAVLELDVTLLHVVGYADPDDPSGFAIMLGLSLRLVPWSPFLL